MEFTYFKLDEIEIKKLFDKQILSYDQCAALMQRSKDRPVTNNPIGEFDENVLRYWLNPSKTIEITSIHFYGGEHFGEPYHWLAEIVSHTDRSHTTRFFNQKRIGPYPIMSY